MARARDVAGGGRAVEVEPERLLAWFVRFAERHGGLVGVDGTLQHLRFGAADGASAEVTVPYDGLPATAGVVGSLVTGAVATEHGSAGSGGGGSDAVGSDAAALGPPVVAVLDALHAHLTVPRRVGIVLVRLGGYSVGVAVDGLVEASTTGARPVHGRNRKGGSSSARFARRRDNQARVALDAAAAAVARFLLPRADALDAVVLGGDASALDTLNADRRLTTLLTRAEPRVLDVPEPRRAVLDEAARRARAVEIVVRERGRRPASPPVS